MVGLNRHDFRPITGAKTIMTPAQDITVSPPPDELLAELDAAARSLDELRSGGTELSVTVDADTGTVRIRLENDDGSRLLTPSQLFEHLL